MNKIKSLLIAITGLSLSLGAAIGVGLNSEKKPVEKAEATAAATYYYLNCDDSIWATWNGFSYGQIGVKYWYNGHDTWDWNNTDPDTEIQHLKTVTINGKSYKRWTYQQCDGFVFYAFNTNENKNQTIALIPQNNGDNVFIVNTNYDISSYNQNGLWKYKCENTSNERTYYLDATQWDIAHASSDYVALFYFDDVSNTNGYIGATRLNLDSGKSFYSATMTGDYQFIWCNKDGENWLHKTCDLDVFQHPVATKNLCIASSTYEAEGDWLLTDGTIKTFTFNEYKNSTTTPLGTYYLFDGESFGLGGVPLPEEGWGYSAATVWHENAVDGESRASNYEINPVHNDYTYYAVREEIVVSFVGEDGKAYPYTSVLEFELDNDTKQYAGLITVSDTSAKMRIKKVTGESVTYHNTLEDGVSVASESGDFIQFNAIGTYSVYFKVSGKMWIQAATARDESYMFAKYFLHNVGCDDDGVNAPSGWGTVASRYATLSDGSKNDIYGINIGTLAVGDAIRDMIECYNWALTHNPHRNSMTHFIENAAGDARAIPNARTTNGVVSATTASDSTTLITIISISVVSFVAIGGYFFFRKRRQD